MSGVNSARDIDVESLSVRLRDTAVDQLGSLKLYGLAREDDAGVGHHDVDAAMRTDAYGCFKQAALGVPVGDIAVLEDKGGLWVGGLQRSNELLAGSISEVTDDNVGAMRGPVTDEMGAEAVGAASDEDRLALEGRRVVWFANVDGR